MHARCVVEPFDVRKHAAARLFTRLEASTVRLLDLQAVPEALHGRVVVTVSIATHRLPIAVVLQMRTQFSRGILAALVGVTDKPFLASFWVIPARNSAILSAANAWCPTELGETGRLNPSVIPGLRNRQYSADWKGLAVLTGQRQWWRRRGIRR